MNFCLHRIISLWLLVTDYCDKGLATPLRVLEDFAKLIAVDCIACNAEIRLKKYVQLICN